MKKKFLSIMLVAAMTAALTGCGEAAAESASGNAASETAEGEAVEGEAAADDAEKPVYKVGIVQFVDDASLNQIVKNIQAELDAKGEELGVVFDYADYTSNGQADSTVLNQIAANLVEEKVDIIVPVATPAAVIMQAATEENNIPVVFSAVTDPVAAGLVASLEEPGANITGTSDALDTDAVFDIITSVNPDIAKIGLLYDKGQDASTQAIEDAKAYCEENGIEVVEKTGTTADEVALAADALIADGVEAVFTPTDNTIMTAELSIFEKFQEAKIPHYAGADSFALNGAFLGYGVNYAELGVATADMVVDILYNEFDVSTYGVETLDSGIATVNTETAAACGIDTESVESVVSEYVEVTTAENFE